MRAGGLVADPPKVRIELMSIIFSHWMGADANGAGVDSANGAVAVANGAVAEDAGGGGLLAAAAGLSTRRGGLEGGAVASSEGGAVAFSEGDAEWERTRDDGERGGEQSFHSGGEAALPDDKVFVGRLQIPSSSSRSPSSWQLDLMTARASYVGARCLAIFAIETGSSHVSEAFLPLLLAMARLRLAGGGG